MPTLNRRHAKKSPERLHALSDRHFIEVDSVIKKAGDLSDSIAWAKLQKEIISCIRCPRLVRYRRKVAREKKKQFIDWEYWGAPLPGFGDREADVVIIGLAPAAHGGNRTGRMFTGDGSANFLVRALYTGGFANQPTSEHRNDGLRLKGVFITAIVRCPPPQNKPLRSEISNCSVFLDGELALLSNTRVILVLGHLAFKGYIDHVKRRTGQMPRPRFAHAACYRLPDGLPVLVSSYHPSRQNTQTGRLTRRMMNQVLVVVKTALAKSRY